MRTTATSLAWTPTGPLLATDSDDCRPAGNDGGSVYLAARSPPPSRSHIDATDFYNIDSAVQYLKRLQECRQILVRCIVYLGPHHHRHRQDARCRRAREGTVKRRRHQRHLRTKYRIYHCASRPRCSSPLTPPAPRQQIVHVTPQTQYDDYDVIEQEAITDRTGSGQREHEYACGLGLNSCNIISASDVTASNSGMMQRESAVTSPVTSALRHVYDDASNANAKGYYNQCISPPSQMSIQRSDSAAGDEIVRCARDGGDAPCAEEKAECDSSSLAQRLLCMLDCCHCCRLTLSFYRPPNT